MHVNVGICNIKQRLFNVVYFNIDLNFVRQRRNNAAFFNADFHNVEQRQNDVVNMNKLKKKKQLNLESKTKKYIRPSDKIEYAGLKVFITLFPILKGMCQRIFAEPYSHFLECRLVANFTRKLLREHLIKGGLLGRMI